MHEYHFLLYLIDLDMSDLDDVVESVCEVNRDWRKLGLKLGLHYYTLEKIGEEHIGRVMRCMREVLAAWLQGEDDTRERTWSVLVAALERIGREELARKIRQDRL